MRVTATPFRSLNKTRSFLTRHRKGFSPMCQARIRVPHGSKKKLRGMRGTATKREAVWTYKKGKGYMPCWAFV